MKRVATLGLFLLFGITVDAQDLTSNDYVIYSKVLNAFLKEEKTKRAKVVLEKESENKLELSPDAFFDSAFVSYSEKLDHVNKDKITFENNFSLRDFKVIIVSKEDLKSLFSEGVDKG